MLVVGRRRDGRAGRPDRRGRRRPGELRQPHPGTGRAAGRAVGGRAVPLADLPTALAETDMLVTCTGARSLTVDAADLAGTPVRGVVDLALPADVAPEVVELGITLVNLDRLVDRPARCG